MGKICICCCLRKPLDAFYTHPKMRDGRLNKCKSCCKEYQKQRREDLSFRYLDNQRRKRRYEDNIQSERNCRRTYQVSLRGSIVHTKATRKWRVNNPEKYKAHVVVGNALRDGKLKKGKCRGCGSLDVHAHHEDYSRPLEVVWLCDSCHKNRHGEMRVGS